MKPFLAILYRFWPGISAIRDPSFPYSLDPDLRIRRAGGHQGARSMLPSKQQTCRDSKGPRDHRGGMPRAGGHA